MRTRARTPNARRGAAPSARAPGREPRAPGALTRVATCAGRQSARHTSAGRGLPTRFRRCPVNLGAPDPAVSRGHPPANTLCNVRTWAAANAACVSARTARCAHRTARRASSESMSSVNDSAKSVFRRAEATSFRRCNADVSSASGATAPRCSAAALPAIAATPSGNTGCDDAAHASAARTASAATIMADHPATAALGSQTHPKIAGALTRVEQNDLLRKVSRWRAPLTPRCQLRHGQPASGPRP